MCPGMAGSTGLRGIPEPTICGIWSYKILQPNCLFVWEWNRNEILLLVQGWGAAIHVPSIRSAALGTYARHCKQYQGGQVIITPQVCNSTPVCFHWCKVSPEKNESLGCPASMLRKYAARFIGLVEVWSILEAWRHHILLEQQKSINYLMNRKLCVWLMVNLLWLLHHKFADF